MTRAEFEAAVRSYEAFAKQHPKRYRVRVALMAMLGYGYVWGVLVLLLAIIIGLVVAASKGVAVWLVIKLCLLAIVLLGTLVQSLWVRLQPPQGQRITASEAPELFAAIARIRKSMNCGPVHRVLIVEDLNAAVVQHARLGVLGWNRNYLICGLPLMTALSRIEFESVLAHELGHLSRGDSRFGAWLYRVTRTWEQLGQRLAESGGGWLFRRFYGWWMPRLNAQSFVLRRLEEYSADAAAVQIAGVRAAGNALLLLATAGAEAQRAFWEHVSKRNRTEPNPPANLFTLYANSLRLRVDDGLLQRSIVEAMAQATDTTDTHPCLRDRLAAMGYFTAVAGPSQLRVPPSPTRTAAEELLAPGLPDLLEHYNAEWAGPVAEHWKTNYEQAQVDLKRLAELETPIDTEAAEEPVSSELAADRELELARLVYAYRDEADGLARMRAVVDAHPRHALANFALGNLLLDRRDQAGVALLECAAEIDPGAARPVAERLWQYYRRTGQHELAGKMVDRATEASATDEQAKEERLSWPPLDQLSPAELPQEELDRLAEWLRADKHVKVAYVLKRVVRYRPDVVAHVLAIVPKISFWSFSNDANAQTAKLLKHFADNAPAGGETYIFVLHGPLKRVGKAMLKSAHQPLVDKR